MANNKIILGAEVLMDLSQDTVSASTVLKGITTHGPDGNPIVGECEFTVDASEVATLPGEVLEGKPFGKGNMIEYGSMPNNGAVEGSIANKDGVFNIPQGYHDGSGFVGIDAIEKAKIIPQNIREGINLLGVPGEMNGTENAKPQAKEVTPSLSEQTILPDEGYNYLSQVKVKAIPCMRTENAAGGITVKIG